MGAWSRENLACCWRQLAISGRFAPSLVMVAKMLFRSLGSAFVAGFSAFAIAPRAEAQSVVSGTVREDSTGRALPGVEIQIEGAKQRALTDSAGRYALEIATGNRVVSFRLPGYQPLRMRVIVKRDSVNADATLVRAFATQLEAVRVNAPQRTMGIGRDGFAERRAMGFGKFVDSTVLRKKEGSRLSDVLRELTGVRMLEWRDPNSSVAEMRAISPIREPPQAYTMSSGAPYPQRPPCWVSVFFNGAPVYRSDVSRGSGRPPDLARDFTVSSLESIEYYKGASDTPQQFGGANADCGALVLWSRR